MAKATITIDASEIVALLRELRPHLPSMTATETVELRKLFLQGTKFRTVNVDDVAADGTRNRRAILQPGQPLLEFMAAFRARQVGSVAAEDIGHPALTS